MFAPINKRLLHLCCWLFLAVLGQACAPNTIQTTWVDQSFKGPINGKILVVGIFKDPTAHKIFEDSFVESLEKAGAEAVPSYKYGKELTRHGKGWLHQVMKESGADIVLVTHLSNQTKQTEVFNPHGLILGGGVYGNDIDGYTEFELERTLVPGNTLTKTTDFIVATLFDSQTKKPIWSCRTKSVDLNNYLRADDEQLDDLYIEDMKRDHIL
ncbi:MAG: hypothetical protein ACWGOX_01990 [Desulforhopalus sp.]